MLQHSLVMTITAGRAKYSGEENLLVLFYSMFAMKTTLLIKNKKFIMVRESPLLVSINNWVITSSTFEITTNLNKSDFGSRSLLSKSVAFKSPIISSLFSGFGKLSVLKKESDFILTQPRISKKSLPRPFFTYYELILIFVSWSLGRLSGTVTVTMLTSLIVILGRF